MFLLVFGKHCSRSISCIYFFKIKRVLLFHDSRQRQFYFFFFIYFILTVKKNIGDEWDTLKSEMIKYNKIRKSRDDNKQSEGSSDKTDKEASMKTCDLSKETFEEGNLPSEQFQPATSMTITEQVQQAELPTEETCDVDKSEIPADGVVM